MRERRRAYLPRDRLMALSAGQDLPERARGSVLFADISGFTPLTEAYEAYLGARKGGEELTRVLNEVYTALIGEVDRTRGSVIGFAGDAITCWFDEDDGHRAVCAAMSMQDAMGRFSTIPSPAGGTIALGLKAAVTTGLVKRFVVGDEAIQRVDVLAGDPVYRVANAEQVAQRGEVVIDGATLEALGQRVEIVEERRDATGTTAGFVVRSLAPLSGVTPWPEFADEEVNRRVVDPWIISAIRERVGGDLSEFITELRPATAMFVKFDGIDYEADPEADRKLDQFFSGVQHIISEYEGVLHQLTLGDKGSFLYAAFGAPISHEDDTVRTMTVALRLRAFSETLAFIRSLRIGIGRGTTRAGAYGGPTRRTYGVLGDQVNLAARLMGKAGEGQILLSEAAAQEGLSGFQLKALPPIRVKGKSEPVTVHELVGSNEGRRKSLGTYAVPMVGRQRELAELGKLLEQARNGQGQVVSLCADTGLGKTRLISEAIRESLRTGFRVLQGECQSFGTNTPYTPWWPICRELFGLGGNESLETTREILQAHLAGINPSLLPRLPVLAPVINVPLDDNELTRAFDAKLRRASLESLLIECLRAEAARQPLLIVLEDVHAIDNVSKGLLQVILQAIARQPILILFAHRPSRKAPPLEEEEYALENVHRIELKEFTREESAELIRRKYAELFDKERSLPAGVIGRISERTSGNPFFIEEVMNWMRQQGIDLLSEAALESADLPLSLHALVLSRMDQLDDGSRVTMKVASVIGRVFRAAVLWGVYPDLGGERAVRDALEILSSRDFTERQDERNELAYLFKHVMIHKVAYESLPHRLRAQIHENIGHFIEKHFPAETNQVLDLLAFHFGQSANFDKQREYFWKAGEAALQSYASLAAAGYFESLLPLLEEIEQIPVLKKLGKALELSTNWKRAMDIYKNALELAQDHGQPRDAAYLCLDIGDLHRNMGAFEKAEKWFLRARAAFEELGEEMGMAKVFHSSGTLAAQTGQYERAIDFYTRGIAVYREQGDELTVANLMGNIGIIFRFQSRFEEALTYQMESLAVRQRFNDPLYLGMSYNNIGLLKRYMGDLDAAEADLQVAREMFEKVGDRSQIANVLNSLAEVALDKRSTGACEAYLLESLQIIRELGNMRAVAFLFEAFAMNAFNQNRPRRCLRLVGVARALRKSIGAPLPRPDEEKIEEIVRKVGEALPGINVEDAIREGASLPLSTALDYAAGVEDSEL